MGASDAVHPSDQTLQSYGLGKLDAAAAESVDNHLEACDACQRRVAAMSSDSFLGRLRDVQRRPDRTGPAVSSVSGLSMLNDGAGSPERPPSSTLPPGLADHPDYDIIRELGQGGMGTVYLSFNRMMGRREVLKVVNSHLINRRGVLDRFLAEIRNAGGLHHTNIVTAYSAFRAGDSIVFAMEYVDGLDLAKLVKAKGPLPVTNACSYAHQAALGLQHANEFGMVHRDIKPSNLMLAKQGNRAVIKVLDFGLAKVRSEGAVDGGLTHEGQMLGTPDYIAPEQIGDARRADIRADIYSLGCTLYYLLTGGPPFKATSLYEILQAHHSMDALPLNLARPEVPVELAALVARMMAKEPERRFQTPADVAQALTPFFKKGSAAIKGSYPDVSQPGRSENRPAPDGPLSTNVPPDKAPPDPKWDSLFALQDSKRSSVPALADAVPVRKKPWWLRPTLAGVLLLGAIVALAGILRFKTLNGTIELVDLPKDAEVFVDDDKVSVTWQGGGKPAIVTVNPGSHKITVKKDGLETSGDEVNVQAGVNEKFTVRFIPNNPPKSERRSPRPGQVSALTKAINDILDKPIAMQFQDDTPLDDVLKYIKQSTMGSIKTGLPIYVDPIGLQEAEKSMTSTVKINLEKSPLKDTLRLVLDQLDLAYVVKDDVLMIISQEGLEQVLKESPVLAFDTQSATRQAMNVLEKPIPMSFVEDTPLEDVLKYIKNAAKGDNDLGIEIYVDPKGLQEAEKSMTSTIRNLDLEGIPLKTTLRLLLKQLDLGYVVKNGLLIIDGIERLQEKAKETADAGPVGGEAEPEKTHKIPEEPAKPAGPGRIAESKGFVPLFNGKDLKGWTHLFENGSEWKVMPEGVLEGRGGGDRNSAFLVSERSNFANFRLRVKFRYEQDGGGQVEIRRSPIGDNRSGYAIHHGNWPTTDSVQWTAGTICKMSNQPYGPAHPAETIEAEALPVALNEWTLLEVTAVKNHLSVMVNGKLVTDYTDASGWYGGGGIALNVWGLYFVQFKEVMIEELPE